MLKLLGIQFLELLNQKWQSSSVKTDQWNDFFAQCIIIWRAGLGAFSTEIQLNEGHFYFSGFFTVEGQAWYFSVSDVRWNDFNLLIRRVRDYTDYTGGYNRFIHIDDELFRNIGFMVTGGWHEGSAV